MESRCCNSPPRGKIRWQSLIGGSELGSPSFGGRIATAGGLLFTAAGSDTDFRAFDSSNGAELWRAKLPASAQSTPMTYQAGGRLYVVICAGGHCKLGTKIGDAVVAFRVE